MSMLINNNNIVMFSNEKKQHIAIFEANKDIDLF